MAPNSISEAGPSGTCVVKSQKLGGKVCVNSKNFWTFKCLCVELGFMMRITQGKQSLIKQQVITVLITFKSLA